MNKEKFIEELKKINIEITENQLKKLDEYYELLLLQLKNQNLDSSKLSQLNKKYSELLIVKILHGVLGLISKYSFKTFSAISEIQITESYLPYIHLSPYFKIG